MSSGARRPEVSRGAPAARLNGPEGCTDGELRATVAKEGLAAEQAALGAMQVWVDRMKARHGIRITAR